MKYVQSGDTKERLECNHEQLLMLRTRCDRQQALASINPVPRSCYAHPAWTMGNQLLPLGYFFFFVLLITMR